MNSQSDTLPTNGRLVERLLEAWPVAAWANLHVVVAVSGGADSTGLLRAMAEARAAAEGKGQLIVAHFNHRLRPGAAEADAHWVAELSRQLGLRCEQGAAPSPPEEAAASGGEEAARRARYRFLRELAERVGARYVATAHTADDQVETVLHHLLRGTGLAGLSGMPATRPMAPSVTLIRPLLGVGRAEVGDYLRALGQEHRVDETNRDQAITRNHLRLGLLPTLRQDFNPEVDRAILRLSHQAAEAQAVIAARARRLLSQALQRREPNRLVFDTSVCANEPAIVVREACKAAWERAGWPLHAMGFDEWQRLAVLIFASDSDPAVNLPGDVRASMLGRLLVLERRDAGASGAAER